jgi:Fe-S oxidoreductase
MPALDGGDVEFARKQAQRNVAALLPLVRQGYLVAAINPTCSLTMRAEYPNLVDTPGAREVAAAVADPHELLYELRRAGKFNAGFRSTPGTVAYHLPCHLKAQNIGFRSRDLIRQIPGAQITTVDACTAHDGNEKRVLRSVDEVGREGLRRNTRCWGGCRGHRLPARAIQIEQATGVGKPSGW